MTEGLIACPSCGAMVPSLLTLRDDQEAAVRRLRRSALLREDDGAVHPGVTPAASGRDETREITMDAHNGYVVWM